MRLENKEIALEALANLHNKEILNRKMHISFSKLKI